MPNSSAPDPGQVPPGAQSPDGNGQVPPTSQDATSATHGGDTPGDSPTPQLTEAQLRDALEKARKDAAKARVDAKRLAELETAEQQRQDAALSEKERHEKQKAEWQNERNELLLKIQEKATAPRIERAAEKLGISEKLALRIMPYAEIVYNDDGDPTNIPELLKAAAEELGVVTTPPQSQPQQQQPSGIPQTGATNPPRGSQIVGANGTFGRDEYPRVTDSRLWKRGG